MDNMGKCDANYTQLTPLTFIKRAAAVYADRPSIIYQSTRFTWSQTYNRCRRLASSFRSLNIVNNDVVSVLAPNVPAMYEMHFAVPMAGAVLNAINTRLDAKNIATILQHSEAKLFLVDCQMVPLAHEALKILLKELSSPMPLVVVIDDVDSPTGIRFGELEYEQLIRKGNPQFVATEVINEWDPIALNYTSGTTSAPKGVVYSHRGAFLSTMSMLLGWNMGTEPVHMWSLPMFHCNGWTFTWGVAARGGTNVCIRNTTAEEMYNSIALHGVTHMCCAPIVFNILLEAERRKLTSPVQILTGGAPPPAALLEKMERLGFKIVHAYGLTEATGPALVCEWRDQWDVLALEERSKLKARQGVGVLTLEDADVKDMVTMRSVPRDGKTMGEIVLRGSSIMKGYFKDPAATAKAFKGGWFWTGDVGVVHQDGYIEIKDRSKDVIISGGENICSIELENVLYGHPNVVEAAVVAMPHPKWGESPCAFVSVKKGSGASESEILDYCRNNLAGFMMPKKVVFMEELPKTATGKIQKFELRAMAEKFKISDHHQQPQKQQQQQKKNKKKEYPAARKEEQGHHDQILALSRL
ncbi:trans-cinnamate:CoA ligase, peroxisomal-like [Impatiens glandulifera]|uniref:trans-cinnamate:CoA ligase, peroxisomal-like n=1 Tax=Impatiens glandulifera TaxID=253017 RepID=UPI001FB18DB9|nr:trans-cinnamate:CoA ligase, peroxisomal-like [Impatiens glandulifera]